MKELLDNFFSTHIRQISYKDLINKLNLKNEDQEKIIDALFELECEGKIFKCDNDSYIHVPKEFYLKFGMVHKSAKGNYYINLEHGDIALIPGSFNSYIVEGDYVFFEPKKSEKHDHQYFANIKRVVDRLRLSSNYLVTGVLCKDYLKNYFYVELNKYDRIYIPNNYLNGAFVSDLVTVRIMNENDEFIGKIEHVLKRKKNEHLYICKKNDRNLILVSLGSNSIILKDFPDYITEGDCVIVDLSNADKPQFSKVIKDTSNYINLYASEFGFEVMFDEKTQEEAENIDGTISEEEINSRVDLRNLTTFTIDSQTAKDLDDAVSIEVFKDKYVLYVSIADVSHYVKPGTALYKTACERTTSIYPANSVIPMLPKELSNGVCSLNPNEDKLCKTVKIEISKQGEILGYSIFNSVINSNMKMSYSKVNDILEGVCLHDEYIPYYETIRTMNKLSLLLQDRRMKRGFICFEESEYEYVLDNDGEVTDVVLRDRGPAQILIENFMLVANEMVASFISNLNVCGAYRNHEAPSIDQVRTLKNKMYNLEKYIHIFNNMNNPKLFQKVLLTVFKNRSSEEIAFLSKIMLRSMNRAFYSIYNVGHYGLALTEYLTFTSPIRRLPDLLNHLVVGYILDGDLEKLESITNEYENLCVHATEKQNNASILEKNINFMLMNKFLSDYSGKELEAKVKFIIKDFIYIKTINGICGIIPLSKGNFNGESARLNKQNIFVGDTICVSFEYIKDYTDEIVFNYIGKTKNMERVRK